MLVFAPGLPWRVCCTNKVFDVQLPLACHGWEHRQCVPAEQAGPAVLWVTCAALALSRNNEVSAGVNVLGAHREVFCLWH